jgi:hypothetical protein
LRLQHFVWFSVVFGLGAACGGNDTPAKSAREASDDDRRSQRDESGMSASAEIGALDEAAVDNTFRASLSGLERCLRVGARRVEFLGGGVAFYIEVDGSGRLSDAYLEDSSLGDRQTERCMLSVLRDKQWPKPVGGDKGYARKSFDFDPPNDVRPPTEWDSDRVSETLHKLAPALDECKAGARGHFKATMYVSTDGTPLGVGIAPPDAAGEAALDCLTDKLKAATFPSPGSWPAKVSFQL